MTRPSRRSRWHAIEAASLGIIVVAASGNHGSIREWSVPACYASTVTVGAIYDELPLQFTENSNRNEHLDLAAPGMFITSAGLDGGLSTFAGTSMSCPQVTGLALLVRAVWPDISQRRFVELAQLTGQPTFDRRSDFTYQTIDVRAALARAMDPPPPLPWFHRGDADDDGRFEITDAIFLLNYLFLGGGPPPCLDAADVNDDERVDLADGSFALNFLFRGGPAPPDPGSVGEFCDRDPTGGPGDELGCESYETCAGE